MTAAEWKPISPCLKCNCYSDYRKAYGRCPESGYCQEEGHYNDAVYGQQKLLKYLVEQMLWIPLQTLKVKPTEDAPFVGHLKIGEPLRAMNQSTLQQMLKDLEEGK